MNIKQNREGNKLTVSINGRVDTSTAPELLEQLKEAMKDIEDLVLDLAGVDYISSAGLRVILYAQKTMNDQGSLTLINVNSDIMDTFELTGFTDILTIK